MDYKPLFKAYGVEGNVNSIVATATATGTAASTEVQINGGADVELPPNAKCLIGFKPYVTCTAPTKATDSAIVNFYVEPGTGSQIDITPFEFPYCLGSHLSTIQSNRQLNEQEIYMCMAQVTGNEKIKISVQTHLGIAGNAKAACDVYYTDIPPPLGKRGQIRSLEGTVYPNHLAAGAKAGTNITFTGGASLVELIGVGVPGDAEVTADEANTGYFKVTCDNWYPASAVEWSMDPMHAIEQTSGEQYGQVSRTPASKRLAGQTILKPSFVKDTTTAAGTLDWNVYVRYLSV